MKGSWPFIRLILRRAQEHASPRTESSRSARLEGWGGHMVRDAAHESAESCRPEIAAPHHEAESDRVRIKLTGNRPSGSGPSFDHVSMLSASPIAAIVRTLM